MPTSIWGFIAATVVATVAAIGAQHVPNTHAAATHATTGHVFVQQMCESHEAAAAGHHAAMAAALGLTAEQLSSVDRISAEACAVLAKYHEQILSVLTPEQRAKMKELHGAGGDDAKPHAAPRHGG